MRKLASQKYDVLDYLLNKDVEYVYEVVNRLGPQVKQAQVLTTPEQQRLNDDEVAVVLFHPHIGQLKKYACNTPEITDINMQILADRMDKLPDEIVKVAAGNLTYVATKYNLDIPDNLAEYTSDDWTENTVDLSRINELNFSNKLSFEPITKEASIEGPYALESQKKYPLDTQIHTQLAVDYFEKNASQFSPEERVEYACNVNKAIEKYNIKNTVLLQKYANLNTQIFNEDFGLHMNARSSFVNNEELSGIYQELKKSYRDLGLKKTAVLLDELDKRANLINNYKSTGFDDAVLTTFGFKKVASVNIDGRDITEEDIAGLDKSTLTDFMDDSTINDLEGEEGLYMLKSLPKPVRDATLELIQ